MSQLAASATSQGQTFPTPGTASYQSAQQQALQQLIQLQIVRLRGRQVRPPVRRSRTPRSPPSSTRWPSSASAGPRSSSPPTCAASNFTLNQARDQVKAGLQQQKLQTYVERSVTFTPAAGQGLLRCPRVASSTCPRRARSRTSWSRTRRRPTKIRAQVTPANFAALARQVQHRHRQQGPGRQRSAPSGRRRSWRRSPRRPSRSRSARSRSRCTHSTAGTSSTSPRSPRRTTPPRRRRCRAIISSQLRVQARDGLSAVGHHDAGLLERADQVRVVEPGAASTSASGVTSRRVMWIVGLGPGDRASVPADALALLASAPRVVLGPVAPEVAELLGHLRLRAARGPRTGSPPTRSIAAVDPEAYAIAQRYPDAQTSPPRERLRERAIGAQVARLVRRGRAPAPRVPVGPRADDPLDRAVHDRGGVRGRRRGRLRRSGQAARRGRRPAVPVGVPRAAARGGRPRATSARSRARRPTS